MKSKLLFLFGLFLNANIYAQLYPALEFENYNPLWTRTSVTDKIPLKVQWYWLEQNHGNGALTIHNNMLYNVYNIFEVWINGYYLEAIDLSTGKLIWENSYFSTEINKRRYAQHPEIHGDSLELMIFEEYDTLTPFPPNWAISKPQKITFNKFSGTILDSSFSINKDSISKPLFVPFTFAINSLSSHLYSKNLGYNYIVNIALRNTTTGESFINYDRFCLDSNGRVIDSLTLRVPTKYQVIYNAIADVEDNSLFCLYYSEKKLDGILKYELGFHYMDKELNVLSSGTLNQFLPINNYRHIVTFSSSDHIIVRSDSVIDQNEAYFNYVSLFDNKGNIIENLDLRLLNLRTSNADFIIISTAIIYEKNKPKVLFCVNSLTFNTLTFYKSDGSGQIVEVNKMKIIADTKNNILMRRMQVVGNNILCLFNYNETLTKVDPLPLWNCWVMINGNDLGLMTASNNVSFNNKYKLKISPNPVSDVLTIEFDNIMSGRMSIYNDIGQLMTNEYLSEVQEFKYNISQLINGKYNIRFITDNKVMNAQFIKVQ